MYLHPFYCVGLATDTLDMGITNPACQVLSEIKNPHQKLDGDLLDC